MRYDCLDMAFETLKIDHGTMSDAELKAFAESEMKLSGDDAPAGGANQGVTGAAGPTATSLLAPVEITWPQILELIKKAARALGNALKDPNKWKVSANKAASGPVKAISLDVNGASFTFTHGGADHILTATPDRFNRAGVLFDGNKDETAHVVVSLRSQFPFKPVILVIEFVEVAVAGGKVRFRFDCPK